jgi:glycosyltransferase involved in cell wall biosynthesis
MVTFAIIGRNEALRLPAALRDACEAARPGDRVIFVDGSSSDGSAEIARARGVEVVSAPPGKGRAMELALRVAEGRYVCFFDADLDRSERNIARVLRDVLEVDDPAMLVAAVSEPARPLVVAIYPTLVGALVPEALEAAGPAPLSGFRAVSLDVDTGPLPPRYGAETYLNLRLVLEGKRVTSIAAGDYEGPIRGYANIPAIAADLTSAILDAAETYGRLATSLRPRWEAWTAPMIGLTLEAVEDPSRAAELTKRLAELAARPLPAAHPIGPGNGTAQRTARGYAPSSSAR